MFSRKKRRNYRRRNFVSASSEVSVARTSLPRAWEPGIHQSLRSTSTHSRWLLTETCKTASSSQFLHDRSSQFRERKSPHSTLLRDSPTLDACARLGACSIHQPLRSTTHSHSSPRHARRRRPRERRPARRRRARPRGPVSGFLGLFLTFGLALFARRETVSRPPL